MGDTGFLYLKISTHLQLIFDTFDHEKNTTSVIGGSHDTILVLFQKPDMVNIEGYLILPAGIRKMLANKKSLRCILDCQTSIRRGKFSNRGEIPVDIQAKLPPDMTQIVNRSKSHYETWVA